MQAKTAKHKLKRQNASQNGKTRATMAKRKVKVWPDPNPNPNLDPNPNPDPNLDPNHFTSRFAILTRVLPF